MAALSTAMRQSRRRSRRNLLAFALWLAPATFLMAPAPPATAADPRADMPDADARAAVRDVLAAGIAAASAAAGATPTPLPAALRVVAAALAEQGRGDAATRFTTAFGQAVAATVPAACAAAAPLAAKLSPRDPWALIGGGDDALTQYFRGRTEDSLARAILPAVRDATARTRLGEAWRAFALAARAVGTGAPELKAVQLENVVADATLTGMYARIADHEKRVRRDPLAQSEVIRRAFGAPR